MWSCPEQVNIEDKIRALLDKTHEDDEEEDPHQNEVLITWIPERDLGFRVQYVVLVGVLGVGPRASCYWRWRSSCHLCLKMLSSMFWGSCPLCSGGPRIRALRDKTHQDEDEEDPHQNEVLIT